MRDAVISKIFKAVHQEHLAGALRQACYRALDPGNLRIDMFIKSWNHWRRDQQVSDRAREAGSHVVLSQEPSSARGESATLRHAHGRSDERRVGKECVSTCRYRWTRDLKIKNKHSNEI